MERKVGPYPFETYGVLIANATTGFELETQTLSLFEKPLFGANQLPAWYVESVMVHELAHQWFGDSVSPRRWSDVWLNEAHATWYEALYAQERGDKRASLETRMHRAYQQSNGWRAEGGPPAAPKAPSPGQKISIFRPVVYDGSALVLYALRQKIGPAAFERLEREWVARHRDGVADTADFVQLASEVAGAPLTDFFQDWLYGDRTPPMPGHPDWRSAGAVTTPCQGDRRSTGTEEHRRDRGVQEHRWDRRDQGSRGNARAQGCRPDSWAERCRRDPRAPGGCSGPCVLGACRGPCAPGDCPGARPPGGRNPGETRVTALSRRGTIMGSAPAGPGNLRDGSDVDTFDGRGSPATVGAPPTVPVGAAGPRKGSPTTQRIK